MGPETDRPAMWTFQPGSLAVGPLAGPRIELHVNSEFPYEVPPQETTPFVLSEEFVDVGKIVGPILGSPEQVKELILDLHRPLQAWVWLVSGHTVTTRERLDWSEPMVLSEPDDPDDSI